MTRQDQKSLYAALGFLAVIIKDDGGDAGDMACRAMKLAELFEAFCEEGAA